MSRTGSKSSELVGDDVRQETTPSPPGSGGEQHAGMELVPGSTVVETCKFDALPALAEPALPLALLASPVTLSAGLSCPCSVAPPSSDAFAWDLVPVCSPPYRQI